MISALVGLLAAGIVGLVVLVVLFAVLGLVLGVVGMAVMLVFKVLPLLLIGWIVVKLVQSGERRSLPRGPRLSASDRAWLDS